MKYMIICVETAADFAKRESAEAPAYWASWASYGQALGQAGVFLSGAGLLPPAMGTSVRVRDGKRHVQDEELDWGCAVDRKPDDKLGHCAPGTTLEARPLKDQSQ